MWIVGVEKLNVKKSEKECVKVGDKEKRQKSRKLKFEFQWDKLNDVNNIEPKHFIHKGRWNKVSRKKTMKPKTLVA